MLIAVRKALALQVAIIMAAFLLGAWLEGRDAGVALLFGGAASLANTGLLWWRWHQGLHRYDSDAGRHLRSFFRSSIERFFVVGILLAAGFLLLRFEPLALLAGFVIGQLAWIVVSLALRERT